MSNNPWFPYGIQKTDKTYKLFCFNHAGGNTTVFQDWINMHESIDVIPVEIPGRRKRMSEKCETDFDKLTSDIAAQIYRKKGKSKIVLYGHSLGGAICFDVAKKMISIFGIFPAKLLIAGRHAPQDEDPTPYRTHMGIDKLKAELSRAGNTPDELLENESFMDVFMPMIFDDYRLHENYVFDGEPIDVPITAISGRLDVDANKDKMSRWKSVTTKTFRQKEFNGGHFFAYNESGADVKNFIIREILEICI